MEISAVGLKYKVTVYYDGEETETETENEVEKKPEEKKAEEKKEKEDKAFTQEQINKILADDRRKNTQSHIKQLEDLKKSITLSKQEKEKLETKIEELNNSLLTKEELAKRERERLETGYKKEKDVLSTERDTWKSRFERSTGLRALTDAAVEEEAFNPEHILTLLESKTRVIEETGEDGQSTGNFVTRVKFTEQKEGKQVVLDLTPLEAVKRMKDTPVHFNLFKSTAAGGLGLGNDAGRRTDIDPATLTPAEYRKWREKQGLSPKKS